MNAKEVTKIERLKIQIERRIAAWLNMKGIDSKLNIADHVMAKDIMERKLVWMIQGDLYEFENINELLEGKESQY